MRKSNKTPNLFIVGAAKAGTTSLHAILDQHPNVFMSPVKEPNFFSKDILTENFDSAFRRKYNNLNYKRDNEGEIIPMHQLYIRNAKNYFDLFDKASDEHEIIGEASVSYLYSKSAAAEIYNYNKNAKIIIVLRNPVERAFSHYLMDLKVGRIRPQENFFDFALQDYQNTGCWGRNPLYLELGLYYEQVKRYMNLFPRENVLIVSYADFKADNARVIDQICEFLEISSIKLSTSKNENSAKIPRNKIASFIIRSSFVKTISKALISPEIIRKVKERLLSSQNLPRLNVEDQFKMDEFYKDDLIKLKESYNISL